MSAAARSPIFATLDAMIAQGYGNVPQPEIPESWREIPREVNQQDRDRVRAEELIPEKERIAAIEQANHEASYALAGRVLQDAQEQLSAAVVKRRPRIVTRRRFRRGTGRRVEFKKALAETRARRAG